MLNITKQNQIDKAIKAKKEEVVKTVTSKKAIVTALSIGIALMLGVFIFGFYHVSRWYDNNRVIFQKMSIDVKIYWPVIVQDRKINYVDGRNKIISPLPDEKPIKKKLRSNLTELEIVMAVPHGEALWKIYQLETQRGKTDYCRNNNLGYGGFGVMDHGNIVCYESFEKAVERAEYWLVQIGIDKDLASALCKWNTGIAQPMCNYSIDYLSL